MSSVRESFNPHPIAADASYEVKGSAMGGFLAWTDGTLTVTSKDASGLGADVLLVDAVPVTAGIYTPIPLMFPATGGIVTLAGGASGTLFV